MIQVQGPDGSSFTFPDGMSHDDISNAMQSHYGGGPAAEPNAGGAAAEPSAGEDTRKAILPSLQRSAAAIAGGAGDVQSLLKAYNPFDWLTKKFEENYPKTAAANKALASKVNARDLPNIDLPTTEEVRKKLDEATGIGNYRATTPQGKVVEHLTELVLPAMTGGVGGAASGAVAAARGGMFHLVPGLAEQAAARAASNIGRYAILPTVASEAAGKATESFGPKTEAIARAVAGLVAPAIGPRLISPLASHASEATRAAHANAVGVLDREGVPLSAGHRADHEGFQYFEQNLDPAAAKRTMEGYTQAVTRAAGAETPVLQHGAGGTVDARLHEVGGRFDRLQQANTLHTDPQLGRDLIGTFDHYTSTPGLYSDAMTNTATGLMQRIGQVFTHPTNQTMTGTEYQTFTSQLRRAARETDDPERSHLLHSFIDHLDDAMERSIARTNPRDAGEFGRARGDYKRALVLERIATAAGQAPARGIVTPAQTERAAKAVYGARAYERGQTPFSEIGNAGTAVLKTLPDSGTSQRAWLNNLFSVPAHAIAAGGGFLAGRHAISDEGGVVGLLLGEAFKPTIEQALRRATAATLLNRPVQHILGNQAAAGAPPLRQTLPGLLTMMGATR